jgi:hypothetical protein
MLRLKSFNRFGLGRDLGESYGKKQQQKVSQQQLTQETNN